MNNLVVSRIELLLRPPQGLQHSTCVRAGGAVEPFVTMLQRLVVAGALLCAADGYRVSPRSSSLVQCHASKREGGGRSAAQVFVRNVAYGADP